MTVNMVKDLRLHNRCTFPRCTGQFNRALVGVSAGGGARLTGWEFDENEPADIPAHDHRTIHEIHSAIREALVAQLERGAMDGA